MGAGGGGGSDLVCSNQQYTLYTMQLGSSRHPRALRVRSTIQLTSIVTKGMTKSSEIDVVINNGDDDDDCTFHRIMLYALILMRVSVESIQ